MSLVNQHWQTFGGEPVTGRAPPRTVVMNDTPMTPQQAGAVAHAYKLFTDACHVAVAKYLSRDRVLADGTKVRMESRDGIDTVYVWPAGGVGDGIPVTTFFCIPFDESYRANQPQDTYIVDRWVDVDKDRPESVLRGLKKAGSCKFLPMVKVDGVYGLARLSHPGNQTWFAGVADHRHSGIVLSWWGQPNRYANSLLDSALLGGAQKVHRHKQPGAYYQYKYEDATADNENIPAWSCAIDHTLSRYKLPGGAVIAPGVTPPYAQKPPEAEAIPPFPFPAGPAEELTAPAAYTNAAGADGLTAPSAVRALWLNGTRFLTDFCVDSACVGVRDGASVVRVTTMNDGSVTIREFPLGRLLRAIPIGGVLRAAEATQTLSAGAPEIQGLPAYSVTGMLHPPYWNADGSEAMGLFSFSWDAVVVKAFQVTEVVRLSGTLLMKITVAPGGVSSAAMETSTFSKSTSGSWTAANRGLPVDDPGINDGSYAKVVDFTGECAYPLAADYRGNTPVVIRAGAAETAHSERIYTDPYPDWFHAGEYLEGVAVLLQVDVVSRATCNGTPLVTDSLAIRVEGSGAAETWVQARTGRASLWAIAGGDIRGGKVVLRESPWVPVCVDDPYPDATDTGCGRFILADVVTGVVTTLANLVHPAAYYMPAYGQSYDPGRMISFAFGMTSDWTFAPSDDVPVSNLCARVKQFTKPSPYLPDFYHPGDSQDREYSGGVATTYAGAGGFSDVAFSSGAVSPDGKIQYIGIVSVALAAPGGGIGVDPLVVDKWFANGVEFTPETPYPYEGAYKMLSSPVFTGPLPPKKTFP